METMIIPLLMNLWVWSSLFDRHHCEHHRDSVQTTSPEGYPLYGAYAPQCDANGQYTPLQCYSSTGECWCVDSTGQERPGTRTSAGTQPKDCDKPGEAKHVSHYTWFCHLNPPTTRGFVLHLSPYHAKKSSNKDCHRKIIY
uniref:Thyroglobulin type-1 domain-containing protein n=1 Tax=Labrus bergylta TaxID=56723 RepID=A0A3Q3FJX4_9LABR